MGKPSGFPLQRCSNECLHAFALSLLCGSKLISYDEPLILRRRQAFWPYGDISRPFCCFYCSSSMVYSLEGTEETVGLLES